jgi:uncharacterized protein with PQ loop repeat
LAKEEILKTKSMSAIQILGLAAGTITSITFLPQVIQIWKTKSAKDLSLQMLLLLILGVSMWLTYCHYLYQQHGTYHEFNFVLL